MRQPTRWKFFNGISHKNAEGKELVEKAYSPMTIRFFILQAHYSSTVDFSNEALQAAEKGMQKLFLSYSLIDKLKYSAT